MSKLVFDIRHVTDVNVIIWIGKLSIELNFVVTRHSQIKEIQDISRLFHVRPNFLKGFLHEKTKVERKAMCI